MEINDDHIRSFDNYLQDAIGEGYYDTFTTTSTNYYINRTSNIFENLSTIFIKENAEIIDYKLLNSLSESLLNISNNLEKKIINNSFTIIRLKLSNIIYGRDFLTLELSVIETRYVFSFYIESEIINKLGLDDIITGSEYFKFDRESWPIDHLILFCYSFHVLFNNLYEDFKINAEITYI